MEKSNKVIGMWSPVGGVGTTFSTIVLAQALSKKGYRVGVLDFDLKTPAMALYVQSQDAVHCLDNVIPFAVANDVTDKIIENNLQTYQGFSYLRGTHSPDQATYMKVDSLMQIVETAKGMFDYLLMDTHNIIDNAGTYVALEASDLVLVVLEKNVITIQQYANMHNVLSANFDLDKFHILLNKTSKDILMEKAEVESFLGVMPVYEIPSLGAAGQNAINQGKWEAFFKDKNKQLKVFEEYIDTILVELLKANNKTDEVKEKKGFLKFRF